MQLKSADHIYQTRYLILGIIPIGMFMSILDGTMVSIALPTVTAHFQVNIAKSQRVITSYLLGDNRPVNLLRQSVRHRQDEDVHDGLDHLHRQLAGLRDRALSIPADPFPSCAGHRCLDGIKGSRRHDLPGVPAHGNRQADGPFQARLQREQRATLQLDRLYPGQRVALRVSRDRHCGEESTVKVGRTGRKGSNGVTVVRFISNGGYENVEI